MSEAVVLRLSIGSDFSAHSANVIGVRLEPDCVYTREARDKWMAETGVVALQALFDAAGLTEKLSASHRRMITEHPEASAEEVAMVAALADELEAKGL